MYVCGPTVYNYAHIGNARPAVVFDTLFRLLKKIFGDDNVLYARNITDVDDKIIKASIEQQTPINSITEKYANIYREDMAALGVQIPSLEPTVTDNMDQIIEMIKNLVGNNFAYESEGHVLFNVQNFPEYGALSKRSQEELLAGARVEVAGYKKNPSDFVLWKPSTDEQPGWDSPWGRGRPGWHIECSAMIERYLGETIDIHGGGIDLLFPHHENEVAQSTCAHGGKKLAQFWMHNGFLRLKNDESGEFEKMSKSLGNVFLVHDLINIYPGEAIRYALLSAQYRQPLDWSKETILAAQKNLDRLYKGLEETQDLATEQENDLGSLQPASAIRQALEDDLNTPKALAELNTLLKSLKNTSDKEEKQRLRQQLLGGAYLLGLLAHSPEQWAKQNTQQTTNSDIDEAYIQKMIEERKSARASRDFKRADEIRDELKAKGIELVDSPEGTTWTTI